MNGSLHIQIYPAKFLLFAVQCNLVIDGVLRLYLRLKIFIVPVKFTKETYLYWYELMQLIRQFELKAEEMYKMAGKIRGFFHAYVGQEAIAAGCMTATRQEDIFITA